jgi:hypothetical protein
VLRSIYQVWVHWVKLGLTFYNINQLLTLFLSLWNFLYSCPILCDLFLFMWLSDSYTKFLIELANSSNDGSTLLWFILLIHVSLWAYGGGNQLHIFFVLQCKVFVESSCKLFFKPQISNLRDNFVSLWLLVCCRNDMLKK